MAIFNSKLLNYQRVYRIMPFGTTQTLDANGLRAGKILEDSGHFNHVALRGIIVKGIQRPLFILIHLIMYTLQLYIYIIR